MNKTIPFSTIKQVLGNTHIVHKMQQLVGQQDVPIEAIAREFGNQFILLVDKLGVDRETLTLAFLNALGHYPQFVLPEVGNLNDAAAIVKRTERQHFENVAAKSPNCTESYLMWHMSLVKETLLDIDEDFRWAPGYIQLWHEPSFAHAFYEEIKKLTP